MIIKVWCDTEANAFSKKTEELDLSDYSILDEEWDSKTEDEQYEFVQEWAMQQLQYGFD